jgi:HNH endonuclease
MTPALADAQDGQCLYCSRRLSAGHIDHFVPWSRYPCDLAHNLVLAHVECNRKKSDLLASESHLERWLERNTNHDTSIITAGRSANIIVDRPATISVATWAYSHAAQPGAHAWVSGSLVEPLTGRWRSDNTNTNALACPQPCPCCRSICAGSLCSRPRRGCNI